MEFFGHSNGRRQRADRFARRYREKKISSAAHTRLIRDFAADWDRYLVLEATQPLITRAGRLAATHALHAYDANHLAVEIIFQEKLAEPVCFASWNTRLVFAARKETLQVIQLN